jgi:hypothetical protein
MAGVNDTTSISLFSPFKIPIFLLTFIPPSNEESRPNLGIGGLTILLGEVFTTPDWSKLWVPGFIPNGLTCPDALSSTALEFVVAANYF